MFCSNCGNQMEEGMDFCACCGNPVETAGGKEEYVNITPEKYKSNKPFIVGMCVLAVAVLLGCIGALYLLGPGELSEAERKKLYTQRIKAYQDYFKQMKKDYKDYDIGCSVTLDEDRLPLLWFAFQMPDSEEGGTQLVGFEDGKVAVLAERNKFIYPCRGSLVMGKEWDGEKIYLYDEKKKDFVKKDDPYKMEFKESIYEKVYSEKELDKKAESLMKLIESVSCFNSFLYGVNEEGEKITYLGKIRYSNEEAYYYDALIQLGVLVPVDRNGGVVILREEYMENRKVVELFESLKDADLTEQDQYEDLCEILERDGLDIGDIKIKAYKNLIKEIPNEEILVLPDGTECSAEETEKYEQSISILLDKTNYSINESWRAWKALEELQYCEVHKSEQILRELQKHPRYTEEELFLYIASVESGFEIAKTDLNNYVLSKASNDYIAGVLEGYLEHRATEEFFTEGLMTDYDALFQTEPYASIQEYSISDVDFYDNHLTVRCVEESDYDDGYVGYSDDYSYEYEFQIEFNEAGDKISNITYIDPWASLPEWKKIYLNQLDMSQVCYLKLTDINADGIPDSKIELQGVGL